MFIGQSSTESGVKYKQIDKVPESGQFVVVWAYGGEVWSETFHASKDGLMSYKPEIDGFTEHEDSLVWEDNPERIISIIQIAD